MKFLAIDTSTARASVALGVDDNVYHVEKDNIREHAQYVLPMVEQLLTEANLELKQLDGIIFGRGPGSFTGLRIACSVVKGLAYPYSLPLYPVSSLAAIANQVFYLEKDLASTTCVLTMIDARMQEVYWDCYGLDGHHFEERVTPVSKVVIPNDVPLIIAGVGFEAYYSELSQAIQQHCIKQIMVYPDARAMIRLVLGGQCLPVSVGDALPVYVRDDVVQKGAHGG